VQTALIKDRHNGGYLARQETHLVIARAPE